MCCATTVSLHTSVSLDDMQALGLVVALEWGGALEVTLSTVLL